MVLKLDLEQFIGGVFKFGIEIGGQTHELGI